MRCACFVFFRKIGSTWLGGACFFFLFLSPWWEADVSELPVGIFELLCGAVGSLHFEAHLLYIQLCGAPQRYTATSSGIW